jgi:hypothetical protein
MSIRALALELYKAQQRVDHLEKEREKAPPQEKERITGELEPALAELRQLRKMLDGAKTESPFAAKSSPKRHR